MGGSLPELETGLLSAGMVSGREERLCPVGGWRLVKSKGVEIGDGLGWGTGSQFRDLNILRIMVI